MDSRNLAQCNKRIEAALESSGRALKDITVVAVTKKVDLPDIYKAIDLGVKHVGESRIQEALLKFEPVNAYARNKGMTIAWHMIGHLQTNKVKDAVRMFDLIHSVDSLRLAEELDRQAERINKVQDILIEVKTSPEATKYGFLPDELQKVWMRLVEFKNLNIKGLMTIAPWSKNPQDSRFFFRLLKKLSDTVFGQKSSSPILSMGMSDDFDVAILEGATMLRLGRAIFGERKY